LLQKPHATPEQNSPISSSNMSGNERVVMSEITSLEEIMLTQNGFMNAAPELRLLLFSPPSGYPSSPASPYRFLLVLYFGIHVAAGLSVLA